MWSFVDHGAAGTGEPLSVLLRPGNAGSNTATDHIAVIKAAVAQLPAHRRGRRAGRKVLIRTDSAGCTHKVLTWMGGQRLSYSVGFPLPHNTAQLLELIPADVWTSAHDAHDQIRDGAWVAELTGLLDMSRVADRDARDRPQGTTHPGALHPRDINEITKNLDFGKALVDVRYASGDVADLVAMSSTCPANCCGASCCSRQRAN